MHATSMGGTTAQGMQSVQARHGSCGWCRWGRSASVGRLSRTLSLGLVRPSQLKRWRLVAGRAE
ncbi:hypothetical protein BJV78DRAFT_1192370 [Lactifluus subvellereus]|nr:hypothetical protein BJV78DRAFT_1192370 [Lactifluus subvellereus]